MQDKTQHQLEDIIIEDEASGSSFKKILILISTLLALGVIGVSTYSLIFEEPMPAYETNVQKPEIPKNQSDIFEPVAISKDDQINKALDEEIKKLQQTDSKTQEETFVKPKLQTSTAVKTPAKEIKTPKAKKELITKKEIQKSTIKVPVVKKPFTQPKSTNKIVVGNFYIQIGSFKKYNPKDKLFIQAKEKGYILTTKRKKDLTRVYIGPYTTRKKAILALKNVRKDVEKDAFIIKQ